MSTTMRKTGKIEIPKKPFWVKRIRLNGKIIGTYSCEADYYRKK